MVFLFCSLFACYLTGTNLNKILTIPLIYQFIFLLHKSYFPSLFSCSCTFSLHQTHLIQHPTIAYRLKLKFTCIFTTYPFYQMSALTFVFCKAAITLVSSVLPSLRLSLLLFQNQIIL